MRLPLVGWRVWLLASLAMFALVALAACGGGEEKAGSPTAGPGGTAAPGGSPARPKTAGAYTTGMVEDIKTNNFWSFWGPDASVYTAYVLGFTVPSLYYYSEERWDWVPDLAVALPSDLVQEGQFWVTTVKLQSDAVWTDGKPITADDAVFTWNTIRDLKITDGSWALNVDLDYYDHAEAVTPTTLKIFFKKKPGLAIWQFGLGLAPILPKNYWEPVVTQAKTTADPVKTLYAHDAKDSPGCCFNFDRQEAGAFVSLKSNPNAYKKDVTVREYENGAYQNESQKHPDRNFTVYGQATGPTSLEFQHGPFVDSVVYNVYADQDSTLLAMQQGEFDFWLSPLSLPKGLADKLAATEGITTIKNPSNGYRYLGFNFRKPPLDNKAFRTAVATLIDREFVANRLLQGQAIPDYSTVPEGNAFWFNPDVPKTAQGLSREERINKALAVMKAAGFTWDVEPKWDPDGNAVNPHGSGLKLNGQPVPSIRLSAPSAGYDALRATFAIWIGEWLKEFGIPVDVQLFGFNVLADKIFKQQDIDMWILGWGLIPFPNHLDDFFDCTHTDLGGNNAGGYCNPQFQALIDKFNNETDLAKAKDIVFQQQIFLADDLPYVVLFDTPIVEAYRNSSIKFPYTKEVDGLQGVHYGLPYAVTLQQ